MDTYAYRPLSVIVLKGALLVTGRNVVVLTALHGLALVFFGLAARGFLTRHGFTDRTATLAALSAMAMPSLLFSAWICVEFDLVGAIFVLCAANAVVDLQAARPRALLRFWCYAAAAMTIKETSAVQLFAYLVAFAFMRRSQPDARRWIRLTAAYVAALVVCTLPMHFVDSGNTHAFTLWSGGFHPVRIPGMLLHTGAQLVFATSAAGIALLVLAALPAARRYALWLALALFCVPVVRHYSHFEAVIFSSPAWLIVSFTGLSVAIGLLFHPRAQLDRMTRTALLTLILTYIGYAAAPIVLRFARADVSARIFAAVIPIVHAFIWRELLRLYRQARPAAALLGLFFVGFLISSAFNTVVFHRDRLAVEAAAKEVLAKDIRMSCPAIVATNPVQWIAVEELRLLGAEQLGDCARVQITTANPSAGMSFQQFADQGEIIVHSGQDTYLFIQTARSQMDTGANVILAGDFSWSEGFLPESDDDLFAGYQRMIYEIETDIETLFRTRGTRIAQAKTSYVQLPLWWNEALIRLVRGVPLVESYDYVARVYRVPAPDLSGRDQSTRDRPANQSAPSR